MNEEQPAEEVHQQQRGGPAKQWTLLRRPCSGQRGKSSGLRAGQSNILPNQRNTSQMADKGSKILLTSTKKHGTGRPSRFLHHPQFVAGPPRAQHGTTGGLPHGENVTTESLSRSIPPPEPLFR